MPVLDDLWEARIEAMPWSANAWLDFTNAVDVPGSIRLQVRNGDQLVLVVDGSTGPLGRAVLGEIPLSEATLHALVAGGETGWIIPSSSAVLRSVAHGQPVEAPVERFALATDERGLVRATIVTSGESGDILDVTGLLIGGCETVTDEIVRRATHPMAGSLCAEVLSL